MVQYPFAKKPGTKTGALCTLVIKIIYFFLLKKIRILRRWYNNHKYCAYPSMDVKKALSSQTMLTVVQVQDWFKFSRRHAHRAEIKMKRNKYLNFKLI
jgi:hypothetical protein